MLVCSVAGARPNFMKMAPVVLELKERNLKQVFIHTGQHYDFNMSGTFIKELGLPRPDIYLGVGPDTQVRQAAKIMIAFEKACNKLRPDLVIVGGDVNSTLAVSLAAAKQGIPVAHVEAGLRSFDKTMPEEVNRIITDQLSGLLFTTEDSANENLFKEGLEKEKIHFVGNCMIDTLIKFVDIARERQPWKRYNLKPDNYALLTLHRPSNVDNIRQLESLISVINKIAEQIPVLFSVHPRTQRCLKQANIKLSHSVIISKPLDYVSFIGLMAESRFVLTDSGGIQEETTILQIPCLTLRNNTERPVTIKYGTNELVGADPDAILGSVSRILNGEWKKGSQIPLWDGRAGKRIVDILESI